MWVKFHFLPQQGITNLTDAEPEALVGMDRASHVRDLPESTENTARASGMHGPK